MHLLSLYPLKIYRVDNPSPSLIPPRRHPLFVRYAQLHVSDALFLLGNREDQVYMAKLAEQAERYDGLFAIFFFNDASLLFFFPFLLFFI